jgi:putative ABC transport system permease protein
MELFFIGWRNVFRHKRRTILNVVALTIGIYIIIIFIGWMRGYFTNLFAAEIGFETGHIQILNRDYLDEEKRIPLDLNIPDYPDLRNTLLEVEEVTARIDFNLKISNGIDAVPVMGRGIDPVPESNITVIKNNIEEGHYIDKEPGILVGKPLAEKLGLKVDDTVYITSYDKYSAPNLIDARVVGIFNYGYPKLDENFIYMDLNTADDLLTMEGRVTKLVLKLHNLDDLNKAMADIKEHLTSKYLEVYSWERFAEVVISAVKQDGASAVIMAVICFILIILGILNSMSMSVHERTQEIGTLRAIGMKKRTLMSILLFESISIALIASVIALILGFPSAFFLQYIGFDLSMFEAADIPIPFGDSFKADFKWYDFIIAVSAGVFTAVIGSIAPVRKAAGIIISRAMGSSHMA